MTKFLIIGLGSMGKRRIRNLQALGHSSIVGFDARIDRRQEAEKLYGISTVAETRCISDCDAVIISTPPDLHTVYIRLAVEQGKPCFVELSLLVQDLPDLEALAKERGVLVAPSCTFRFHPSIRLIKEFVNAGSFGRITNFVYHSGQYLPDWHPWENIRDFFVSKRETSGCKEILSFELHWLTEITGFPRSLSALRGTTVDFGIDMDDTVAVSLDYERCVGVLLIDVVSRFATRSLTMNLERGQIRWDRESKAVRVYNAESGQWVYYPEPAGQAQHGAGEQMYIEELRAFIAAAQGAAAYPLALSECIRILQLVGSSENNAAGRSC
ncbi:MAG: Gfo/Idh/MocA family oxidoreductase [Dissulfurispiraceae bacterium]